MAALIIGWLMWSFTSTGIFFGGGKIDVHVRKRLSVIGMVLFYFGLVTTIITVSLLFGDFLKGSNRDPILMVFMVGG